MTFIKNIEKLKEHVIVSSTFDFKKVLPFTARADRKFIIPMIGKEQYDLFLTEAQKSETVIEVVKMFEEASANYAMYLALPTLNLLITNNGAKTTETSQSKDADWREVRDLKRTFIEAANEAVDLAMEIMEQKENEFPEWQKSDRYTLFKNLVVRHTRLFNQYFNIQNSRKTFLALKPYMLEVEDQYLNSSIGACTLEFLKKESDKQVVLIAQEYLQKAVVAFTIAKAAIAGTFCITDTAFVVATEELSWDKKKLELDEAKLERLHKDRENAGANFLQKLIALIKANTDVFDCYETSTQSKSARQILKRKGFLAI